MNCLREMTIKMEIDENMTEILPIDVHFVLTLDDYFPLSSIGNI